MLEYVLRWLMPASKALEALKRPLEAHKTVNQGQGSLNHVNGLKQPINQ
jgi:2-polyprenyl-3-methyl-5-hydroxy-6-metoxy-1,4-benzoquinol methylase